MKLTSDSPVVLIAYGIGIRVHLYGKKVDLLTGGRGRRGRCIHAYAHLYSRGGKYMYTCICVYIHIQVHMCLHINAYVHVYMFMSNSGPCFYVFL